jgi:large subunit ribosomal protein L5
MSRLKKRYKEEIANQLKETFQLKNVMMIPKMTKLVIHMGVAKESVKDKNIIKQCVEELAAISGQQPIVTKSTKSISNFKLREGYPVGVKVTLRGDRMYDFIDRFVNIIAPMIRDFRGFNKKCDGSGNYSLGLEDQQIFPEINLDNVKRVQGMHITFVTSAKNDEQCVELLRLLGMPFKDVKIVVAA